MKQELEIFLHRIDIELVVLHSQVDEGLTVIGKNFKKPDVNKLLSF